MKSTWLQRTVAGIAPWSVDMLGFTDHVRHKGLADLLDYDSLIDEGIMQLYSGGFLAAWRIVGPDMDMLTIESSAALCRNIASALKLTAGWTLQTDLLRNPVIEYAPEHPSNWPDPVSKMLDHERRRQFTLGGHFLGRSYFCLTYHPIRDKGRKGRDWLFEDRDREGRAARDLRMFRERIAQIDSALHSAFAPFANASVERLKSYMHRGRKFDRLCEYIRHCISGDDCPMARPPIPHYLNYRFAYDFLPGADLQLNQKHVAVIVVDDFPEMGFAGIMRGLEAIAFPIRYTQQAQCMEREEAVELHKMSSAQWQLTNAGWFQKFTKKGASTKKDHVAIEMEAEADRAGADAQHGREHDVHYTAKIIVMADTYGEVRERITIVGNVLRELGFATRVETINATRALISSFPGHAPKEVRVCPATVSNFSHMMPLSTPFRGFAVNESRFMPPGTPPLLYATTVGQTPFRLHLHSGDVGHTLNVGPTGSGKTTFQGLAIAQWFRYPEAQVFAFDKEKTLYTLTKAMGGDFYDLSPDGALRFCPLAHLETAFERSRAASYIELLCSLNGLALNATQRNEIDEKLLLLAEGLNRSLTDFQALIGAAAPEISDALQYFTIGSAASGGILDGQEDRISLSRLSVFEVGTLYRMDAKVASGVLFHIFDKIRDRLDPTIPTLVALDEFRSSLDQPLAVRTVEEFLIEGRKKNMAVLLAIQELGKILDSPLCTTINRECRTKIFLPNASAKTGERKVYETFGCTDLDIEYIADAQPAREYYFTSPSGRRMIDLGLGRVALAFLARSGKQDRELVDQLIARHGDGWVSEWLRLHDCADWIPYFEQLRPKDMTAYA